MYNYILGLLEPTSNPESPGKRFWTYIKSRKKDQVGITTLKDGDTETSNSQEQAEILNRQYKSVFSQESSTLPTLGPSEVPDMPDITFSSEGIEKLLKGLNTKKATGPDEIPARILKEAAEEIAPCLKIIFQDSWNTGSVPSDWRKANVSAVFKKGDKTAASNYRPVSLTSIPCKLLEHILFSSIMAPCD